MTFTDFAHRIGKVLRGADNQSAFTKSLFEMILPEEKNDLLEGISDSTWKSYFNGAAQIRRLAKKINAVTDPMLFVPYIDDQEEPAVQKLCETFRDVLPEINLLNAGEEIAGLFDEIINEAADDRKEEGEARPAKVRIPKEPETDPFRVYIHKAVRFYSRKKTLLYAETPRPFYSMYVCNDLRCQRFPGIRRNRLYAVKQDATVPSLEENSKYNIVQGTGGIGKSMFMTHLFLSSAAAYSSGNKLPVLALLKEYKEDFPDLITFILRMINEFDPETGREALIEKLKNEQIVLLLDGLDEIKSHLKESFEKNLESFIKCYPGNSVFMTSRPIAEFIAYSQFTVYDLEPLRLGQAVELVKKLEFWDEEAKKNFIDDLETHLYVTHWQFASNPLLLTIMLMTYSIHGDIPAKMHVFYAKAYETMARLHDATKGSFKRLLYTGLTPERFADYFSQFCARTFVMEQIGFTKDEFVQQMKKVIENVPVVTSEEKAALKPTDFLRDLTDNLCMMYCEGEKYYFIHRSFQEYFAALYFVSDEDDLVKAGEFLENHRSAFFRNVLEMMCDMAEDRVERFVFFPYLDRLFRECGDTEPDLYLRFLLRQYPVIYYDEGEIGSGGSMAPKSRVYSAILHQKNLAEYHTLNQYYWPEAVQVKPDDEWIWIDEGYLDIDSETWEESCHMFMEFGSGRVRVRRDALSPSEREACRRREAGGTSHQIEVGELLVNRDKNQELIRSMMNEKFPLFIEYQSVRRYYGELKSRVEKKRKAKSLFDD